MTGAVLFGVVSAIGLIIISPIVWGGAPGAPDTGAFTWYDLNNPGLISIPLGFVGCIVGTLLSTERETERSFHELYVRSETGLGAERPFGRKVVAGGGSSTLSAERRRVCYSLVRFSSC